MYIPDSRLIFYDFISIGDELFSDVYPMKVIDGVFFEIEGKVQ